MIANLGEIMYWKYQGVGYEVVDRLNGNGPTIEGWQRPGSPPTEAVILGWEREMVIERKLQEVQVEKSRVLNSGFMHGGILYDSDEAARIAYGMLGLKFLQTPSYSTSWKASGEIWVTMTVVLFAAVQVSYEQHMTDCFAWQAQKQQEIAAASTTEVIKAISTSYGG